MFYLASFDSTGSTYFKGYYLDVNSMYPYCMLKVMLVGNPSITKDKTLDSYFGFCYANITPPAELKVLLIAWRNENGELAYPNAKFSGIYLSE
jgi:DNA polymerase type B, organellar and viral